MELLKELCSIHAPSGEEVRMKEFILSWLNIHMGEWKTQPVILDTPDLQDSLVLVFGKPRTAIFAHMDSTGFTVRYNNELIFIGGPDFKSGNKLVGYQNGKHIETLIMVHGDDEKLFCNHNNILSAGTSLTYKPDFRVSKKEIISPYLDNRLGVWIALQIAKTLENGILVFSCNEEHGGGSVEKIAKIIFERFQIRQALISDITWATDGIFIGKGVVVSLRDKFIPRKSFIDKICCVLQNHNISFQCEVESSGSSDGGYLQRTSYPIDWCFIGIPEEGNHSNKEKVSLYDVSEMLKTYKILMNDL
jgi:putative aminopeptidase FrvX